MPLRPGSPLRQAFVSLFAFCLAFGSLHAQTAPAPVGPDLTAVYNSAMGAFDKGDYQGAVSGIKNLLSAATLPPDASPADVTKLNRQLEPVYFTLGAAYFNLKDYGAAIEALQDYIKRYPQGARLPEAQFSLAQASYLTKDYDKAAAAFAALENNPRYREDALLFEGLAFKEAGNVDKAIGALEKLTGGGIRSQNAARGAMQLIAFYSEKKQTDKAFKMLAEVQANLAQVENVVELNAVALNQGDAFLQDEKFEEALTCYRAVRVRSEVLTLQGERLTAAQRRLLGIQTTMRANPKEAAQYTVALRQAQDNVADDTKLLQEFEKLPPIRPKLLYRMGRAFSGMGRPWEALVVYNDAVDISKDPADKETALFAQVSTYADVNQPKLAREISERYLKEFPNGANASTVGYLLGATALQEGDAKAAEGYFGRMLAEQPASTLREEIRFLLPNAQFAQGEYEKAKGGYKSYLTDYTGGTHTEEALYRVALCDLFAGKYDLALTGIDDYLKKYPNGASKPDALYRRAVCQYAYQDYDKVIDACQAWLKKFPNDQQTGEVEALLGDCYAARDKPDQALDAYTKSYKAASTDEVLNYSIMEASKILQKRNDWETIDAMFEEFIKDHPEHPMVVTAAFWIGRAKVKLGRTFEAKQYIAAEVKKYIDDPKKEAVEQLLSQLVTLCVRKRPAAKPVEAVAPSPAGSATADAAAVTPVPTPETAPTDPGAELDELLGATLADRSPTARARVLYAKAQLAQMRRQPAEYERNLLSIAKDFKPEALSAPILGQVGDFLLGRGDLDGAAPFYQHLMDYFGKSDLIDFAYNGLGEIAYQKKDYPKALGLFSDGVNKVPANLKLKDLTVGQAKTLLVLGRLDEAKKLFEQVASVREWRGESTAFSVYSLGEIEAKQGHWAEANAHFQRVYVAYQKFLPWVAKAYIASGESLEKLDKKPDAIKTYQEMLRNKKLTDFTETSQARERLAALGAS